MAGDRVEVLGVAEHQSPFERGADDGLADGVLGVGFGGGRHRQQLRFVADGAQFPDGELPFRQRAGLVQRDVVNGAECLERLAGAHEYALFGGFARAAHDGQWRGDARSGGFSPLMGQSGSNVRSV